MNNIDAYIISNIGNVRENHEDNFFIPENNYIDEELQTKIKSNEMTIERDFNGSEGVFAVCDGMGGHNKGEVASRVAAETLKDNYRDLLDADKSKLIDFVKNLNNKICNFSKENIECSNMGTTFSSLIISKDKVHLLHVGDSRVYKVDNQKLIQVSSDHTEGERLVRAGIIKREDLLKFPNRKLLYKYLGRNGELIADAELIEGPMSRFIIASDGLSDTLTDEEILDEVLRSEKAKDVCHNLLKASLSKGNKCSDNVTIISIDIK